MAGDRLKGRRTLAVADFLDEFEKDDIKKGVDIVALFRHFGVSLAKKGKGYMGKCPWHDDSTPSLSVDNDKGLYNCFGCGESGDIFTLTAKMKGLAFRESVAYLKEFSSTKPVTVAGTSVIKQGDMNNSPDKERPLLNLAAHGGDERGARAVTGVSLDTVVDWYHRRLFENSGALEYLKNRGLADTGIITRFKIGFADGSIFEKLSDTQKKQLIQHGIITDRGKEHFAGCITVPIFDGHDMVVGMYGRNIGSSSPGFSGRGARGEGIPHLYLKGKHRGVFNRKASKVYDEIILTESIIDALSLISLGFENTQGIYGTNGFTDEHLGALKDDRVKTVILAFDNDEAGRNASLKLKEKLLPEGFTVKVVSPALLPLLRSGEGGRGDEVKDWNEYLVSGGSREAIAETIAAAEAFTAEKEEINFKAEKDQLGTVFTINGTTYRVSGTKEMFVSSLRVNIKANDYSGAKYYDNLDLYSARSRSSYAGCMGRVFDIEPNRIEKDLVTILEHLEAERDRHLLAGTGPEKEIPLTPEERELGLSFLKSPYMFTEIVEDMDLLGYVGEDLNKQLLYIAATSRKLDDPVSVIVISESASGKSMLIDTVIKLIPPEEVISVTSLSEQALNYMEDLSHKFVSLGEIVHSETIEHQIREMLSKKELSRLVTTGVGQSGKMVTKMVKIPAVVSLAMSGTRYDMNPENTSRCFVVNTDESREQTRRIHEQQRKRKYSLERDHEKRNLVPRIVAKHHAAQKLLRQIAIVNPFAGCLDFPDTLMRTRRDHDRFIDLIASVCFLRQYQKEIKRGSTGTSGVFEYIECDLSDYEIAYPIMTSGVLASSLLEMPPGAIELYEYIRGLCRELGKKSGIGPHEVGFTQREIREHAGLNHVWVKRNIRVLVDYEYVVTVRGGSARSKGHYRIREDAPMEAVNLSMIPSPEEVKRRMSEDMINGHKLGQLGQTGSDPDLRQNRR